MAYFAMSQSPPSQSPIRYTTQDQESPSSAGSDAEDVAGALHDAPRDAVGVAGTGGEPVPCVSEMRDVPMQGDDDDDGSGSDCAAPVMPPGSESNGPASGVQVPAPLPASESEGEEEEDAPGVAPAPAGPAALSQDGLKEEEKEEEAEDEPDVGHPVEQEQAEPDAGDAQMVQEAEASQEGYNLVAATASTSWGSTLPPGCSDGWTTAADVCSLKVAGTEMKLPKAVFDRLYGYQREGIAWMWNIYQKGFGGILADEMGLGKTVQAAAFLACLKFTGQGSRFLVVVPLTLMEQWRRELEAWAADTGLAVHMYHGTAQERRAASRGMLVKGGVMLINYDLVRNCINALKTAGMASAASMPKKRKRQQKRGVKDDDSPSEEEPAEVAEGGEDQDRPWDVVFVDEGHQIKNPSCQSGKALRKLRSRSRFLLSGTPLQNKLSDLWALMDFVQPSLLGNFSTFEQMFSEQIAKGSKRNASRFDVELKDNLARELKRLTAPHFLRRLKSEVCTSSTGTGTADQDLHGDAPKPDKLPNKTDCVLWLNLTQAQQELYTLFLGSDLMRNISHSKCGMEALRGIALLKKLCNHPLLCLSQEEFQQWRSQMLASGTAGQPVSSSEAPLAETQADTQEDSATQPAPECQQVMPRLRALVPNSVQGAALLSCKLRVLSVLLPQLQKRGHRALIFSQSTRMLDLIQMCVLRVLGLKFLRIDGTIEAKDRDLKLQKFHAADSRYFCMCLSVQVGGTGLTITGADRVILVDPAWNPSMDSQAIDRVHRIGQDKDVVVYRLIGAGAIEDKMFRLQIFKRGLSKTYLEQESQVRFFSHKELKTLFEPPNQSTSTQSLMAAQIGPDALEHEDLLNVVAGDIGSTDDPQALPFWQSSDVLGFSDYSRLFSFLEQAKREDEDSVVHAKQKLDLLKNEEYVKDQVVENKFRKFYRDVSKENMSPQEAASVSDVAPLQDAEA
jgi:hypothetical protein